MVEVEEKDDLRNLLYKPKVEKPSEMEDARKMKKKDRGLRKEFNHTGL